MAEQPTRRRPKQAESHYFPFNASITCLFTCVWVLRARQDMTSSAAESVTATALLRPRHAAPCSEVSIDAGARISHLESLYACDSALMMDPGLTEA
jgi:hypothetical protein